MLDIKEIMGRTTMQNLRAFLLEGLEAGEYEETSYEERLKKGREEILDLLREAFPEPEELEKASEKLEEALLSVQRVYMENRHEGRSKADV